MMQKQVLRSLREVSGQKLLIRMTPENWREKNKNDMKG